jgi:hypothetical protein
MPQVIAERDDYPGAAPIGSCQSARLAAQRRTSSRLRHAEMRTIEIDGLRNL